VPGEPGGSIDLGSHIAELLDQMGIYGVTGNRYNRTLSIRQVRVLTGSPAFGRIGSRYQAKARPAGADGHRGETIMDGTAHKVTDWSI